MGLNGGSCLYVTTSDPEQKDCMISRFLYMTFWASLGQQRYRQYNMMYAGFWTDLFGLICRVISGLGQQYGGVSLCRALTCLWTVCIGKQSSNSRLSSFFLECSIWIGKAGFYGQQDSR
ncbi:unnamed protein product [Vicia faba]|uniref:Uncharacterized protein n=1 Tax=Vicia faba TaxID=3906 RepID=A0AAV0Z0Y1_VICFA|nr:unnamed protein product [Vicia faba]